MARRVKLEFEKFEFSQLASQYTVLYAASWFKAAHAVKNALHLFEAGKGRGRVTHNKHAVALQPRKERKRTRLHLVVTPQKR